MEKINHPEHYKGNKYEAIDIIDDYQLGFNLGNAVKYILRAGKKGDAAEDLKKAKWYIEHEICKLMNEKEKSKEQRSKRCSECKRYETKNCRLEDLIRHGYDISDYCCYLWEAKK